MDHAEAHERIADLALEPARFEAFRSSHAPADQTLRAHVEQCPDCQAEVDDWARTHGALRAGLADVDGEAEVLGIRAPESLRARVVEALHDRPGRDLARPASRAASPRAWRNLAALATAAAVVVLLGGGLLVTDQRSRLDAAGAEARALQGVVAAVDRVLAAPNHRVVELRQPDGSTGGSIAWSRHDLVVLSTSLPVPEAGATYRCWLSEGGSGWAVGEMKFAGRAGYWVGTLDEWATFVIGPETVFRVSLEPPGADPSVRSGPIVLEARLASS